MSEGIVRFTLASPEDTTKLGILLGRTLGIGDVLCLEGELGTGKTTLCQALAQGLELHPGYRVNSPSFAVLHEYPAKIPLYHMDFYRLSSSDEVLDMGLDEFFYGHGATVIEWASKAADILPADRLEILLTHGGGESRKVTLAGYGERWLDWLQRTEAILATTFGAEK